MSGSDPSAFRSEVTIDARDPGVMVELLDANLRNITQPNQLGMVSIALPRGAYVARFHKAGKFVEKLFTVKPEGAPQEIALDDSERHNLAFPTPVPVDGTTTSREWQGEPASLLSRAPANRLPGCVEGGAHLLLFHRDPNSGLNRAPTSPVSVHSVTGELLFNMTDAQKDDAHQWRGVHLELDPGTYLLRRSLGDGRDVDQVVPVLAKWQTQAFIMEAPATIRSEFASVGIPSVSLLFAPAETGFEYGNSNPNRDSNIQLLWTESAQLALARSSLTDDIGSSGQRDLLWAKFGNPMLGVFGALLHLRAKKVDGSLMRTVFENLYRLVGPLPDVLAIGWELARRGGGDLTPELLVSKYHSNATLGTPPMLRESAVLIEQAQRHFSSTKNFQLVSENSLADRVEEGAVRDGPWVCWNRLRPIFPAISDWATIPNMAEPKRLIDSAQLGFGVSPMIKMGGKLDLWRRESTTSTEPLIQDIDLAGLVKRLQADPEVSRALNLLSFTDQERELVYWLLPKLNPRYLKIAKLNPKIEQTLEHQSQKRIVGGITELADALGLSVRATIRSISRLSARLFARQELPSAATLRQLKAEISRSLPKPDKHMLDALSSAEVAIDHPVTRRRLKLLEARHLLRESSPDVINLELVRAAYQAGLAKLPSIVRARL